jgi:RHS repeat-associated protein
LLESDRGFDYEYDDEGNRTKRTHIAGGDYVEYEWDYRNRLTGVRFKTAAHALTKQVEYEYDVQDRRTVKRVDANADSTYETAFYYLYDEQNIVLVYDGSGSLTNRYLHGPAVDQILADENAIGDVLFPLADNQGTVRDVAEYDSLTDTTSIVKHLTYNAFGAITNDTAPTLTFLYAYTGREWDADAGLYYYRARWYDPVIGRFISEDPIGFDGDPSNISRYARNSPTLLLDPSGLDPSAYIGCEVSSPYYAAMSANRPVPPPIPPAPDIAPGPEWKWHGKQPVGGPHGVWQHPNGEYLHPNLDHKPPKKPHWEWKDKWGNTWEYYPDTGKWIPKKVNPNKPQPIFPPGTFDVATKIVIIGSGGYILKRIYPFINSCMKPAFGRCFITPIMLDIELPAKPHPVPDEFPGA